MTVAGAHIVFVSGLSGSGKTTATAAIEDLGFYCVDSLPAQLIEQFLDLCAKSTPPIRKIALALDAREAQFLRGIPAVIERLRARGTRVQLIFLECSNQNLMHRYRETRRVHPLSPGGSVSEGIETERRLLAEVSRLADFVVDTSELNIHQLRETVAGFVAEGARPTVVSMVSFGFRYGAPSSAELLFDARLLPNPHFEPRLRSRSGEDPEVAEYVLKNERGSELLERLRELLEFLLRVYDEEGKPYLTVAVGCTGGRHRSVAIVKALASELRAAGRDVNVTHRDVEKQ